MRKFILFSVIGLILLALIIQLVPYGKDHTNPPVQAEPAWDSPATRALAKRACFDCHSHETVWPWYSNIAPVSWLVYRDVAEGRRRVDFSDWNRSRQQYVDEFQTVYYEHSMPPGNYLLLHPEARLSDAERKQLFDGLAVIAASYRH